MMSDGKTSLQGLQITKFGRVRTINLNDTELKQICASQKNRNGEDVHGQIPYKDTTTNLSVLEKRKSNSQSDDYNTPSGQMSPDIQIDQTNMETGSDDSSDSFDMMIASGLVTKVGRDSNEKQKSGYVPQGNRKFQTMESEKFQKKISVQLDRMERRMADFMRHIESHSKGSKSNGVTYSEARKILPYPLTTKQEVDDLEQLVTEDPSKGILLMEYFQQMEGSTPSRMTNSIMYRVFDPAAASCFNIRGVNNKQSFKHYRLYEIIIEAVRKTFPSVIKEDEKKITFAIEANLRQAGARLQKKIEKEEKARSTIPNEHGRISNSHQIGLNLCKSNSDTLDNLPNSSHINAIDPEVSLRFPSESLLTASRFSEGSEHQRERPHFQSEVVSEILVQQNFSKAPNFRVGATNTESPSKRRKMSHTTTPDGASEDLFVQVDNVKVENI